MYYHRGLANYKNKNYEAAIVDLERALKFHPRKSAMANIYFHIGISQANLGNKSEVIEPLTLAISFDPQPKYYH